MCRDRGRCSVHGSLGWHQASSLLPAAPPPASCAGPVECCWCRGAASHELGAAGLARVGLMRRHVMPGVVVRTHRSAPLVSAGGLARARRDRALLVLVSRVNRT
jgi:hypothetical protein